MTGRQLYFLLKEKLTENDEETAIRLLFEYYFKKNYALCLNEEIDEEKCTKITNDFDKYLLGYPIAYIINETYFLGNKFYVDDRVLIPRMETEEVVSFAMKQMKNISSFVDLGTGSGIIAITLKRTFPEVKAYAVDISKGALEVFEKNKKDLDITSYRGDMLKPLIENNVKVDMIISNPPYINKNFEIDERVEKEPSIALLADEEGMYFYKQIIEDSSKVLNENGIIVFEIGYDQKEKIERLCENSPFSCEVIKDINGNSRIAFLSYK